LKFLVVLGTRPEAIKLAPVITELSGRSEAEVVVCSTGQHLEMLQQVFDVFDLNPDISLSLMSVDQSPNEMFARTLVEMGGVLQSEQPDYVVVQGDTTTAAATALAAFHAGVDIVHVEAGLRSGDILAPFPEEVNRRIISTVSTINFCPTNRSSMNLIEEGVDPFKVFVTGNTVIDALEVARNRLANTEIESLINEISTSTEPKKLILVTAHRRENIGDGLASICGAIKDLTDELGDQIHVIFPVHLNPNVDGYVRSELGENLNITLLPPLDYLSLVRCMDASYLILTDSGGIQEEAPSLSKPVLVLRDVTERPEGVELGVAQLVGTDRAEIVEAARSLIRDDAKYLTMSSPKNPYGDGRAAERIADVLLGRKFVKFDSCTCGA
jgi:UDP-N-acetylglucosamine 2-epimerase (non-hydrolysing)